MTRLRLPPVSLRMVVSVHISDVGARRTPALLRAVPKPRVTPGLRYAEVTSTGRLGSGPRGLTPGRVALLASWDDDQALDRFLSEHPLAQRLAGGWHVRLEPRRVYGSWPEMPELPTKSLPMDDDEQVVVLTLGRLKLHRAVPFLRASEPAEKLAIADPAILASTALVRPPRFVSTFSVWRSTAEMRAYAIGKQDPAHVDAMRAHSAKPFHSESAFVRFRPYGAQGSWDGRNPLA